LIRIDGKDTTSFTIIALIGVPGFLHVIVPDNTRHAAAGTGTTTVEFTLPLADSSEFPPPDLAMLPLAISPGRGDGRQAPGNAAATLTLAWARNALALVARAHPGRRTLVPAYHCPALVEPFLWANSPVEFYPMAPDLAPDMAWLERNLAHDDTLVVVPFFGVTATNTAALALARERGCLIVEDLAHAAFKPRLDGHYGVTSLQKFYPVDSGAELFVSAEADADRITRLWRDTMANEFAWRARALREKTLRRMGLPGGGGTAPAYRYLHPGALGEPMRSRDRRVVSASDTGTIVSRRRQCYERLSGELADFALGEPLYPTLGPADVPYVFPLLLHEEATFRAIRAAALPLYRWEEIASGHCATSDSYRHRLVQLPCHQDLSEADIELLLARLAELGQAAAAQGR
jgi:hypothetical protein